MRVTARGVIGVCGVVAGEEGEVMMEPLPARPSPTSSSSERMKQPRDDAAWSFRSLRLSLSMAGWNAQIRWVHGFEIGMVHVKVVPVYL